MGGVMIACTGGNLHGWQWLLAAPIIVTAVAVCAIMAIVTIRDIRGTS